MAYECRVERDSISPQGIRLVSMVIRFPRIVLAEAITHRANFDTWGPEHVFCERTTTRDISKNSASSRAIPFARMVDSVLADPYRPQWTQNQRGMQGSPIGDDESVSKANRIWDNALAYMVMCARELSELNVHKQDVNRLLEPFAWITQIVTSSRWDNFFALRCHKDAHPALRHVARMMYLEYRKSVPTPLDYGQWHLPFVPPQDALQLNWTPTWEPGEQLPDLIKFSAARCAWVSYENHDKLSTGEAMLQTWDRLMSGTPRHASPVEHQATPMTFAQKDDVRLNSNLTGWLQARKLIHEEEITCYNPSDEEVASWGV